MESTPAQFATIEHCLPRRRGNVSLSNLQVVNVILYVAEHESLGQIPPVEYRVKQFPDLYF